MSGPSRIGGVGRALSWSAAAKEHVRIPTAVSTLLAAEGVSYMANGWVALSEVLKKADQWQHRDGGIAPCSVIGPMRTHLSVSRATAYRYLKKLGELDLLGKSAVEGKPQRGPGTLKRYFLRHALWRRWKEKLAADARRQPPRPQSDTAPAPPSPPPEHVERGPPPDPDGPRSGAEAVAYVKARLSQD